MMEDKDWLKSFGNTMKDYEEPAPEGLWEDIESSVFPRTAHRVLALPVLWRSVAAAAVVALGVFAGLRLTDSVEDLNLEKTLETLASSQPSASGNGVDGESPVDIVPQSGRETMLAESRPIRWHRLEASVGDNAEDSITEAENAALETVAETADPRPDIPGQTLEQDSMEEAVPESKEVRVATSHDGEDWSEYISASIDASGIRRKAASLDVSFSEGAIGCESENLYDLRSFYRGSAPSATSGLIEDPGDDDDGMQTKGIEPMETNKSSTATSRADHKRPVRVALTVNYPLGNTLGLETGLMMTTLRSTFSNEIGRTLTETDQTLRYLGVPLNLTVSILESGWGTLYAGAGGMVEKCLSGKSRTSDLFDGVMQGESVRNDLNVKPLLWSVNASAGLQVNLSKRLGIYAEPGLSYHLDDNSEIRTIYKERPLDFSLTFGARISLR